MIPQDKIDTIATRLRQAQAQREPIAPLPRRTAERRRMPMAPVPPADRFEARTTGVDAVRAHLSS